MRKSQFCRWLMFCGISVFLVVLNSCNTNTVPAISTTSPRTTIETPSITLAPAQPSTAKPMPSPSLPPATLAVVSTMNAIVTHKPEFQELYHYYQDCVYMPKACVSRGLGLSPNGAWAVFFTSAGIRIISVDNTQEWEVTFSELSSTEGAGTVSVAHWSQDGRYVYVVPRQDGADGGYEWFWGWRGTKLIRLDLQTGTWVDTRMGYAFSFSPDEHYLAYRSNQGIHIHELATGQEKVVTVKYLEYGRLTWSPDSQKILFVATPNESDLENRQNGFTALLLDVATQTIHTVFENNTEFFYPIEWKDMNNVLLEKLFEGFGEQYKLDVDTGVITQTQNP
jgi:hypothetical protein